MGSRITVRFERVAAAFDVDMARVMRVCQSSSGSEHSNSSSTTDLSDLVKSFMEKNDRISSADEEGEGDQDHDIDDDDDNNNNNKEMLRGLFAAAAADDDGNAKEKIRSEAEVAAWELLGHDQQAGLLFKRRFMSSLRHRGFDAGLCKSKWEKNKRIPAGGEYEYVDVNFDGKRYIVEICLGAEFQIARPTNQYSSMLDEFPPVFVGKAEELKQVVRLMCTAIKGSMKRRDLHVPPWRRNEYVQAKWFASYKRTTNEVAARKRLDDAAFNTPQRSIRWI